MSPCGEECDPRKGPVVPTDGNNQVRRGFQDRWNRTTRQLDYWRHLWEVVAVDGGAGTCDVKPYEDASGTLNDDHAETDVDNPADAIVGDTGQLARYEDDSLYFVPSGEGGDDTFQVYVSSNDSSHDYLLNKVAAGTGISITELNDGGDEDVEISCTVTGETYKVMVTSNDSTPDYLLNKLAAGSGITLTELNDGADEDVQISSTVTGDTFKVKVSSNDTTEDYLINKLTAGTHINLTETNDGGNETVQIDESGTRQDETESLTVETRTSDPGTPEDGRIWLRTDL